jgi:hypothetical protein
MRYPLRVLAAATMSLALAGPAAAHEVGVLRPSTTQFAPGGTVRIAGERFTKEATLALVLIGTRGRLSLGTVQTDSTGRFTTEVVVPREAVEGSYRLVAFAADGDRVAGLDVTVVAATAGAAADEHAEHHAEAPPPTAEPLQLDRARSGAVTGGAIAVIALGIGLGLFLLRRRPATA